MEAERFAPPRSQVSDVMIDGGVQPVRFWPPNGRIGRLRLMAYILALYAILFLGSLIFGVIVGVTAAASRSQPGTGFGVGIGLLYFAAFVLYAVAAVTLFIQRSHDMDLSGWWSIAAFIPLVGLFWLVNPGTRGVNRWGAPPPPNGLAVTIFGWLLPALMAIGIVAAIAVPALMMGSR